PDTFGHSQDLPRILNGFGIASAVVWRGVPSLPEGPVFRWLSPDGSSVIAYHLTRGYYQSAFHESITSAELASRLKSWLDQDASQTGQASPYCGILDAALYPVGCDHLDPPSGIEEKIARVKENWRQEKAQALEQSVEILPLSKYLSELELAV